MSQINTSRIENQDTSAGTASTLKISPLNAAGVIPWDTVVADQNGVTTKGNPSSGVLAAEVVANGLVTCLGGITALKNVIHSSAPTTANHLCNKTYVDSLAAGGLENQLSFVNVGGGTAAVRYYVNGSTTAMIFGAHADVWSGARANLVANLYNASSGLLQTIILSNVNEGGNTDSCNQSFFVMFAITIPLTCAFIDFTCSTRTSLYMGQHINR
jgi:hypothetical protein